MRSRGAVRKPSARTFPCPVGCGRNKAPKYLMCRPCWAMVPQELRGAVYDGASKFHRQSPGHSIKEDLERYRNASAAAVTVLEGQTCQTWIRGRIEFLGVYFFRTYSGHVEALESLSRRDARVRQVRS